jgi:hypothetical protein
MIPGRWAQGSAAAVHPSGADAEDRRENPVPAVVAQDEAPVPAEQAHKAVPEAYPRPMAGRRSVRESPTKVRRAAAKPHGLACCRRAGPAWQGPHRGRAELAIRIAGSAERPAPGRHVAEQMESRRMVAARNAGPVLVAEPVSTQARRTTIAVQARPPPVRNAPDRSRSPQAKQASVAAAASVAACPS